MINYDQTESERLMEELRRDPASFRRRQAGGAFDLLQQFHRGLPLETLHQLLRTDNDDILSSAVFIMSELAAGQVEDFIDDAIRLSEHSDPRIRHSTNEVLVRSTVITRHEEFLHVMKHIEDPHPYIRRMSICYFSKATSDQLSCATTAWERSGVADAQTHTKAARLALAVPCAGGEALAEMIKSPVRLKAYYGLGIAARNLGADPNCACLLTGIGNKELDEVSASLVAWVRPRERKSIRLADTQG